MISVLREAFLELLVFALFISILFFGIVEISTGGLLDWVLLLFILELRLLSLSTAILLLLLELLGLSLLFPRFIFILISGLLALLGGLFSLLAGLLTLEEFKILIGLWTVLLRILIFLLIVFFEGYQFF